MVGGCFPNGHSQPFPGEDQLSVAYGPVGLPLDGLVRAVPVVPHLVVTQVQRFLLEMRKKFKKIKIYKIKINNKINY